MQPLKRLQFIWELCAVAKDLRLYLLYWVLKLWNIYFCWYFWHVMILPHDFTIMFPGVKFTFTSYHLRFRQSNVTCTEFPCCVIYKWGQYLEKGLIRYCLLEDFHKCRSCFPWLSLEAEFLGIEIYNFIIYVYKKIVIFTRKFTVPEEMYSMSELP